MRIGIIGAGNIGGALTRRLTALGYEVAVANSRGPESLAALAAETGAKAVTAREAAQAGEIAVVTIPMRNIPDLPKNLFAGVPAGVTVIDTGNYYPQQRDGRIAGIEDGLTESRWVEGQLGRSVIKTFNNIYAKHLQDHGKPKGTPGRIALPVAGDDAVAKAKVMGLVDALGLRSGGYGRAGRFLAPAAGNTGVRQGLRCRRRAQGAGGGKPAAHGGVAGDSEKPGGLRQAGLKGRALLVVML